MEALDRTARRFPLVPRARPPCPALDVRVREVRDLAQGAASAAGLDRLTLAAAALNRAALIASDCGLPELARSLCWRHHRLYLDRGPMSAETARLAMEPLVNLARLRIRAGDGEHAHNLLDTLYRAVRSRTDAEIDGTQLSFRNLTDSTEAHRTLCRWLWTVLIAEGSRGLATAGRWELALAYAQQHGGIGLRLLDGRQVAIVAHCLAGRPSCALAVLEGSAVTTPWERCLAACLHVLCLRYRRQPAAHAITDMAEQYHDLLLTHDLLVFDVRLGLAVVDLAGGIEQPEAARGAARAIGHAVTAGDGLAAREILIHAGYRACLADRDERALAAIVRSAGLERDGMPKHMMADLLGAAEMSVAVMHRADLAKGPCKRKCPGTP